MPTLQNPADNIHAQAVRAAQDRAHWLARAADTQRCAQSLRELPRRRCLALARKAEQRVIDLAIWAEIYATKHPLCA